jgi:ribosomal protein S27AE
MIWERKQERQNEQEAVYLTSQVYTPHGSFPVPLTNYTLHIKLAEESYEGTIPMSSHACPKCGHSFHTKYDPDRLSCRQCGTSWNTGTSSDSEGVIGCVALIVVVSLFFFGGWFFHGILAGIFGWAIGSWVSDQPWEAHAGAIAIIIALILLAIACYVG